VAGVAVRLQRALRPIAGLWLLALAAFGGGAAEHVRFHFVQISDTHFGSLNHSAITARAVADINALPFPIACVVHTGDLFADNAHRPEIVSQALDTMGGLTSPVHYVAGNHDLPTKRLAESLAVYTNHFGGLCSTAEYHGVLFVMLYTEPLRQGFEVAGYDPLAWLERVLAAADGKPVLIFHHAATVEDFYGDRVRPGWPAEAREKWNALIASANVKAVFTGHFHRDELHWKGDVPVFVAAPIANYWGRQSSYRIYEYDNGRVGYRTRYIER
jgi:3',5'-cyclic AMP phosphodiesterase CpdA